MDDQPSPLPSTRFEVVPADVPAFKLPDGWRWVTRTAIYDAPAILQRLNDNAVMESPCLLAVHDSSRDLLLEFEWGRPMWRALALDRSSGTFSVVHDYPPTARIRKLLDRTAQGVHQRYRPS